MSRGRGTVQQGILDSLAAESGEAQVNALCWQMGAPAGAALPLGFYKSFRRALDSLQESGAIGREERELADIDEIVTYYPSKATTLPVKQLRQRLLPVVKSYLDETNRHQFGAARNEHYVLRNNPPSQKTRAAWLPIESTLLSLSPFAEANDKPALIALLAAGRWLVNFDVRRSSALTIPFGQVISDFLKTGLVAKSPFLDERLRAYYERCIDKSEHRRAELKDRLYAVVNFGENQAEGLKEPFKRELLRREPDYVRSLPDHADATHGQLIFARQVKFSGLLDALLRRDVLRPFAFIRLAG